MSRRFLIISEHDRAHTVDGKKSEEVNQISVRVLVADGEIYR